MELPVLYFYNNAGVYTGCREALPDPIEAGKYLVPHNATTTPAAENKKGFVQIFDGNKWHFVEDHVGKTCFNKMTKEPVTIDAYGVVPDYLTDKPFADFDMVWSDEFGDWVLPEVLP